MDHKEKRFESDIETYLLAEGGYTKGTMETYDKTKAIDLHTLIKFIAASQDSEWKAYQKTYSQDPSTQLYTRLSEEISEKGLIHVLRNGISDRGHKLKICYFEPESDLNPQILKKYNKNILTCTRQFYYSAHNRNSIDMVLSLNGIPIVGIELKNQLTGQSIINAKYQFMYDRDPRELCFHINTRFLVYFAVDLFEITMTTKLDGKETIFLPFNQGSEGAGCVGGAGNPKNPDGYTTSYLWENVLKKDKLLSIIQRYIHASQKKIKAEGKASYKKIETLIFPRYHQLDVVTKILKDVKEHGSGKNYLIQHSAGSGKSNSIAWLSYRLASIHKNNQAIFTSVIIVTDRRVLDKQLQDTISSFDHELGWVQTISEECTAQDLKQAIIDGKKMIITTLQKFPVVYEELKGSVGKRFAVIVDEAHSSQTGSSANALKVALADTQQALAEFAEREGVAVSEIDTEDIVNKTIITHGKHQNLSFFAFTATPKQKTLEIFGTQQQDGSFKPFHIYSMRQAIEEEFIHDVLLNYKTYQMCVQLIKSTSENPELPEKEAIKAIKRYESLHPHNIKEKVEVMIDFFKKISAQKINGKAKAMLVTASRLHAIRYFQAFKQYIAENQYTNFDVLVAFSGTVKDDNIDYSESSLNKTKSGQKISENQLPEYFKSDDFQLLIVAEKYQTGFDEPLLHTMFVDKKLSGVKAVQTLSRLNRTTKGKHDTAVVDFVNTNQDIKAAFEPFFETTTLDEEINVNLIYSSQEIIRNFRLYNHVDINKFNQIYQQRTQSATALGKITSLLSPIQKTYLSLNADDRFKLKKTIRNFVKGYQYITQIIRIFDKDIQNEFNFLKYLEKVLPSNITEKVDLDDQIKLEYYKLEKTFEGQIELEKNSEHSILKHAKTVDASRKDPKEELLDLIIERINQEFVGLISEFDRIIISTLYDRAINDRKLKNTAKENVFEVFASVFQRTFKVQADLCYSEQLATFEKLFQNKEFYQAVMDHLSRETYLTLRNTSHPN